MSTSINQTGITFPDATNQYTANNISLPLTVLTSSGFLTKNNAYVINASGLNLTLPATPKSGDTIKIINKSYINGVLVRNGSNIMGVSENMNLDVANVGFHLTFTDSSQGWTII